VQDLIERFVTLWVVIDPIGTVPVFIAVTAGMDSIARRRTALQAALVSAGVLLFFLAFGQLLIDALGIRLGDRMTRDITDFHNTDAGDLESLEWADPDDRRPDLTQLDDAALTDRKSVV